MKISRSRLIRRGVVAVVIVLVLGIGTRRVMRGKSGTAREIGAGENDIAAPAGDHSVSSRADGYILLSNPQGSRVVDVKLSDGTRVWLNAGSSIRYPAVFPSNDRTVEVSGEAYFEVAGDSRGPLRVKRGNLTVDATGGSFDLRAYQDVPLEYVTVVSGSLRVRADNEVAVDAGDQAVVNGRAEQVKDVHTDGILAWKNGLFSFSHTTLVDALRELSHWYGIQFEWKVIVPDRYVTGVLDRELSLDQVLKALTRGRVRYSIDARRRKLTIE